MKKLFGILLSAILVVALLAVGLCVPTYLQWKEIRENFSFTADYIIQEEDSTVYKTVSTLGLEKGRLVGNDCGNGTWYVQLYGADKASPYTELYIQDMDLSESYVNVTMLCNTIISGLGEKVPMLKGLLKEWDSTRYLALSQWEEITGMALPLHLITEKKDQLLPYANILPLVRLLPTAYKEDGYRYYQFEEGSQQLIIGIADLRTPDRGVNIQLNVPLEGTRIQADLWLKASEGPKGECLKDIVLLDTDSVQLLKEIWGLLSKILY